MKNSQQILILGLGGIGTYLALRLAHDGHAITIIESDPELIARADGVIDARLIQGDAMSFSCWRDAEASKMDHLIAVTNDDAVNILASVIAKRCGIPRRIARVRERGLWTDGSVLSPEDCDIDLVIQPEELAAQEVARLLKMRSASLTIDLAEGKMQVIATRIRSDSSLANRKVKDIAQDLEDFPFRIVAIARDTNTLIPGGENVVEPGDLAFFLARSDVVPTLMLIAELGPKRRQRVMILGGGLIGSRIAELFEDIFKVTLLERDGATAELLSQQLRHVEVLHGDGADTDTLLMAGLLKMDTVIAATGVNETNIMASVLAKNLVRNQPGDLHGKDCTTITFVKREQYLGIAAAMGNDIVLNKKILAGDQILENVRRGEVLQAAHLNGVEAEAVELVAGRRAPITKKPLSAMRGLANKIIIGGVYQDGEWHTAIGSTKVQEGDRVIAVCLSDYLPELERLVLG